MKRLLSPLLLLFAVISSFSQVSPTEKAALQAFYNALDGPNWTSENDADPNNDWDFSGPVTNNWFGLYIVSNGINSISLNQNNLTGVIPSEINDLINIEHLSFRDNQITGLDPIGNSSLWTLDISFNQLTNLDFRNYTNLDFVYASDNLLTSVLLRANFYTNLDLSNNQLAQLDISNTAIENLFLRNNQLTTIDLSKCIGMMDLDLSHNNFAQIDLSSLQSIFYFDVSHNNLTELHIPDLTDGLFYGFIASHNQLSTLTVGMFGPDFSLSNSFSEVDISYNMLSDHSIISDFFNYRSIEKLDISNNQYQGYLIDTSLLSLNYFHFDNNRYEFGHIIGHQSASKFIADHSKSPQAKLDTPETRNIPLGANTIMTTNCSGAYNVYQWYKNGVPLSDAANISGSTSDTLTINNLDALDTGVYHCEVNSTAITGLTLIRENITLNVMTQPCDVRDRAALIALYNSTDGPNWVNNTNWNTAASLDTWFGVTTNASGCVISIDMNATNTPGGGNGLNGTLPIDLGYLFDLAVIDFAEQNLSGILPSSIGNLTKLISLDVSSNQISGSLPTTIGNMDELQILLIDENQLTGVLPQEMGNLSELRYILGQHNQFSGGLPETLGNLSKLEVIWLYDNLLTGSIPLSFSNLSNLRQLLLSNNQIGGLIPDFWANLPQMEVLWLGANQLSGTIPTSLSLLSNLEQLHLQENQLTGSIPVSLANLNNLLNLFLGDNPLTGTIPPEFGTMSALEELGIYRTQVTGTLPSEIGNLTNMRILWIGLNNMHGQIPSTYSNLLNIEQMFLDGNQLTGGIPPGFANFSKIESLSISDNLLEGAIPDFSGTPLNVLQFENNRFQFGDFENQFAHYSTFPYFYDNPQAKVNEIEVVNHNFGETVILQTMVSGNQNHYKWFKDGVEIVGAPDSHDYTITNVQAADAGVYHCEITSDIVTDLTLVRNDITLSVGCLPPAADDPESVVRCESFVLPSLSVDNFYYTATNAGGMQLNAGEVITSSQTLYIYTGNPGCSDENTFLITIDLPVYADSLANVIECDGYVLTDIANGNYFTESGGQGIQLFAGDTISNTQTIFIYLESGTCSDENSFEAVIDPSGCIEEPSATCEVEFPNFFTPNSDGTNDTFRPLSNPCSVSGVVNIYDRYGKLLYQADIAEYGWDGTFNSSRLPSTDYWFQFENSQNNEVITGHFSLKR